MPPATFSRFGFSLYVGRTTRAVIGGRPHARWWPTRRRSWTCRVRALASAAAVETQGRDLLGDQPDEEDDDREGDQQHRGVRHMLLTDGRPDGIARADDERRDRDRHEDAQRTKDRDDAQHDQQELRAVLRQTYFRSTH